MPDTKAAALAWHNAGVAVLPAKSDGTKAPIVAWKQYQTSRPQLQQIEQWYSSGHPGLGLLCGKVSGGLEMVELEARAMQTGLLDRLKELAKASGLEDLLDTVTKGPRAYCEATPSGGAHILYRITGGDVPGNTKLAQRPTPQGPLCLAETRGEGGYVITAPSHGTTHPTGKPWQLLGRSKAGVVPELTRVERDLLIRLFLALDEMPTEAHASTYTPTYTANEGTPGNDFEARTDWSDELLLGGQAWVNVYTTGKTRHWRRPGKTQGISATTGRADDRDRLYVFSSSTIFNTETPYTKFAAYAAIHHAGDYTAAASMLRQLGYGTDSSIERGLNDVANGDTRRLDWVTDNTESVQNSIQTNDPLRAARISAKAEDLRVAREAKQLIINEEHEATWTPPTHRKTLTQDLEEPDEQIPYVIEHLMPEGANILLTAQFKAGKTSLCNNLMRSLADNVPFLGKYRINSDTTGRIAVFNYEVSEVQYRHWLRSVGIVNTGKITVLNLRGHTLPLMTPKIQEWVGSWLAEHDITTWIVDPFARAFSGAGDENDNSAVGAFLETLDVIKEQSGVSELIVPTHTGKGEQVSGQEVSRGATRLLDWADALWFITKDNEDRRYFRASGRDVEVEEAVLNYDPERRWLIMGEGNKKTVQSRDLATELVEYIRGHPGLGFNELISGLGKGRSPVGGAIQDAVDAGLIMKVSDSNRKQLHFIAGAWNQVNEFKMSESETGGLGGLQ